MNSLDSIGEGCQRGIKVADHGNKGARFYSHCTSELSSGAQTKNVRECLFRSDDVMLAES